MRGHALCVAVKPNIISMLCVRVVLIRVLSPTDIADRQVISEVPPCAVSSVIDTSLQAL